MVTALYPAERNVNHKRNSSTLYYSVKSHGHRVSNDFKGHSKIQTFERGVDQCVRYRE